MKMITADKRFRVTATATAQTMMNKSRITFRNPKALFDEGDTSVSAYYRSLYINDVAQMISKTIGTMDFKYWRQAIIQYNAWASTRNRLYGENNELLAALRQY